MMHTILKEYREKTLTVFIILITHLWSHTCDFLKSVCIKNWEMNEFLGNQSILFAKKTKELILGYWFGVLLFWF